MTIPGKKMQLLGELMQSLTPIPEGAQYQSTVPLSACPRCGEEIPEDNDTTGEGPVYWTQSEEPYCGMECVVAQHRKWLKEQKQ